MPIEPETKIVQSHFGGQASLKPRQVIGTLPCQTEGIQELVVDGFDDLPQACQPAKPRFGPRDSSARLMRWSNQIDLVLLLPPKSWPRTRKAFVGYIRPLSRQATAKPLWRRCVTSSKQGSCQVLIMRARTSKAKAGNDSLSRDGCSNGIWWINRSALSKPPSGRFSSVVSPDRRPQLGVRPIQLLLPTLSPTTSRHDTATAAGFLDSQAETSGKGQVSTSRAVHRQSVLPATIAGVRSR